MKQFILSLVLALTMMSCASAPKQLEYVDFNHCIDVVFVPSTDTWQAEFLIDGDYIVAEFVADSADMPLVVDAFMCWWENADTDAYTQEDVNESWAVIDGKIYRL